MEETKELQTTYKIFRYLIYLSLIVEFFEYAINPELLDYWGGILVASGAVRRGVSGSYAGSLWFSVSGLRLRGHGQASGARQPVLPQGHAGVH